MSDFDPSNAVAVNETSQGTTPADTGSFNVDRAVPVNEANNGNTSWENFKNSNAPEVSDSPSDSHGKVASPSSAEVTSEAPLKPNKGQSKETLQENLSRENREVKVHTTVPSPDYPPENWLNATLHLAEGAIWDSFVKPFSKSDPDMDQYLSQLEKKHPIASIIGGTAPYIATAPFLPQSLVPNIYLMTSAQFGLVGLGAGINRARQDPSKELMDKVSDVAKETLKQMAFAPIFAKAQTLKILDRPFLNVLIKSGMSVEKAMESAYRPFVSAAARSGFIAGGSGIMSFIFGSNLNDAFKQGGLYGALSLISEMPHLAGTVVGRGIIAHTNSIYADMAKKAGLPDVHIDVDANYVPEATEDLTTKKYHVREISDLLSASESGGLIKSDEGEYSRMQSGWPSFLSDKGYSRDDLNNIFDKFINDQELTDKQKSTLDTILKDAEPFTKGLTPIQKQIHTVLTAMANQVPGIHDPQIVAATIQLPDGTQIHGSSHEDAMEKIGYKKSPSIEGVKVEPYQESTEIKNARERALAIKETYPINTPERDSLRNSLVDKFYGNGAVNKNKRIDLVLGLPAAGKGKFLEKLSKMHGSIDIDNDRIKEALPEYNNGIGASAVHEESALIESRIIGKAFENDDNMTIAWLGKNDRKISKYIDIAKKLGYEIHVINVDLPADKAMSRAQSRFKETGRFVDPQLIKEISLRTMENNDKLQMDGRLATYAKYSNDVPIGSKPRLISKVINRPVGKSGGLQGGHDTGYDAESLGEKDSQTQIIHPGFTVSKPDGTTDFITRHEATQAPYNLPTGHSSEVQGLNESKWMEPQEPKITNPDTLAMIANNEGKMDINMIPGIPETAEVLQKSHAELKEKFAPYNVGEEGPRTTEILRENLGILARNNDKLEASLNQARKLFDKANKESSLDFIYRMEEGQAQESKDLQKIADTLRNMMDTKRDEVIGLGTGKMENWIENYFPHVWEDPNKVGVMIKRIMGKRPFEGTKSFLKKRTIPTTREGIDLGFTPVSYNPIDSVMLKVREMERYIMAHRTIQALKEQGIIEFVRTGNKAPDNFVPIDDRFGTVTYKNEAKELVLAGKYMIQKDAGRILNNYLSPGLRGKSYIYDMYRGAGNTLNQFQLGISAFHLGFTSMDATISKFALGINKLSTGDFAGAIKEFGKAPFAPITNILQGRDLLQAWYGKDKGELTNTIADMMASAGGRAKMDKFYATGMSDSFNKSLKEGKLLTAALKVPFYIVDQMARPIMEYIVPRQKMGVFMDMMKMELERNPNISHEQLRTIAQKAWDSVDNRMGQLVYDNLFWNHVTKDLAMASVRSLGWNLGTIREIGGGVKDVIGNVEDVIHGRGTKMSYRTAYVMALPIVTGLYGVIYQYLHTGQTPQSLKDLYFPRNGAIDNKGQPARVSLPTYMKDIYHYTTNPVQTVINKFSPVNNAVMEMIANKDFYGTQIRNVDDPIMQQVLDELTFVGGQFEPFGFRNLGRDTRTSAGSKIEPFIGITPAPYDINMTKAEREAYELAKGKIPVGSRTKEEAQHSQAKSKLASDYMASKDPSILDDAVSKGIISAKERRQIIKLSGISRLARLTRDLTFDEVNHVLKYATEAERPELERILQKKRKGKEARGTWTPEEEKIYDQTFNP